MLNIWVNTCFGFVLGLDSGGMNIKKISLALLALLLAFFLIGCDSMVDYMGKMGKSVAGVDEKVLNDIKNAAKAKPSKAEKGDAGSKKFSSGSGEEMFSVKADGTQATEIKVGDVSVPLKTGGDAAKALAGVESILAPKDLSDTLIGLKSESTKAEAEKHLKEEASKEDKEAAEGTQKVIAALVEAMGLPEKVDNPETEEDKTTNAALETLDKILGNIEEGEEKVITNADVVVLTAITNVVFGNSDMISSVKDLQDEGKTEEEKKELEDNLVNSVADQASTLLDVVSVVPSDMASGIMDVLSLFTK